MSSLYNYLIIVRECGLRYGGKKVELEGIDIEWPLNLNKTYNDDNETYDHCIGITIILCL